MSAQKKRDAGTNTTSSKNFPIKRREILVLLGFWLAGCAIVTVLIGLFYANASRPQAPVLPEPVATYTVQYSGDTAKVVYLKALIQAQNWSEDAELVALSTVWTNNTTAALGQPGNWDFRFYSPQRKRLYFVVVTPDGRVLGRAHFKESRQSPLLVNPTEWVIDSDEVLLTWFNSGGGPFVEAYSANQVQVLLRQTKQGLVWDVIGASADQSQMFYVSVSAVSGEVQN